MFDFIEFDTIQGSDPEFCCIETSKKAAVMQYSLAHTVDEDFNGAFGDPFMMTVPPVPQYLNNYTISSAKQEVIDFEASVSIAIPIQFFDNSPEDQAMVVLNGSQASPVGGSWTAIYCSNGQICGYGGRFYVGRGTVNVYHENPVAGMNVYLYGFTTEVSFGMPAGYEVDAITCKSNSQCESYVF